MSLSWYGEESVLVEFLIEAVGWLFGVLLDDQPSESDQSQRRSAGYLLVRFFMLLSAAVAVILLVGVPILWASGAKGLTAIGLLIGAGIAARVAQLLARYSRTSTES
jgi:hypothetical protein